MIEVKRVDAGTWPELVRLFEESRECAECWCMNHRRQPSDCPTGAAAKVALREELLSGRAFGLLAFVGGSVAGWCAVDPVRTQMGHDFHQLAAPPPEDPRWMIHCLYVGRAHRGAGVSKALIQAASELAREMGAPEILAFPIPEETKSKFPPEVAEFSGRLSTFRRFGFEPRERLDDFYQVVAKDLRAP